MSARPSGLIGAAVVFSLILTSGVMAQSAGRPLALEDYYRIENVSGPAISPDGSRVAYGNSFSFEQQFLAANGYMVVYTNPRASTGYGEDFRWAIWADGVSSISRTSWPEWTTWWSVTRLIRRAWA